MPDPLDPPAPGSGSDPLDPGASAAAMAAATLTDSALRQRPVRSRDGAGGYATTYADAGPFACLLTAMRRLGSEQEKAGTEQSVSYWQVHFAVGTDVLPKDRLVIGGYTHEVTKSDAGATGAVLLTVDAVRVL